MAENIVSTNELDSLFADLITSYSGLASDSVLISYSEKGKASFQINSDVCFVHTEQVSDYVDQYKNRKETYNYTTEKVTTEQSSMRIIKLQLVFYGPNADVLGAKVKEKFYLDSAKQFLYKNNMSLISEKDTITKTHEKVNERWWDRVDVNMYFYNSVTIEETVNTIVDPVITFYNDLEV